MKLGRFICMFPLLLLTACGGGGGTSSPPITTSNWTLMVYVAADNDLDVTAPLDLNELKAVGSTANVNVIVQHDTRTSPTRIYKVEKGNLVLLKDPGELNMATPEAVRDFVVYGMQNYPADHYALVVWSHGEAWSPGVDSSVNRAVIEDWNNSNLKTSPLANQFVAQGIKAAEAVTGRKLAILGFDACSMATIEAAYELKDTADILVSSQSLVQGFGWDYRDLLVRLTNNPMQSPVQFATAMVASYQSFVESPAYGFGDQTISAVYLGQRMDLLAQEVNAMANRLRAEMDSTVTRQAALTRLTNARAAVQGFSVATYVDLHGFSTLADSPSSPVQAALNAVIIAEYHGTSRPGARGLSVVFYDLPTALSFSVYDPNYINYNAASNTGSQSGFINDFMWDDMMHAYFGYQYPSVAH